MNYRLISKKIKYFIHRNLNKLNYLFFEEYYKKSNPIFFDTNSQLSQDFLAAVISDFKKNGVFIEFGATNGIDLSNTYFLEKHLNWTGILVEPINSYFDQLKKNRPNSICLNKVVFSESNKTKTFYVNNELSVSGLHKTNNSQPIIAQTISLNDIFESNNLKHIDYLSIDTEGSEFSILQRFDFNNYSFKLLTVEHNYNFFRRKKIYNLLTRNGYKRIHKEFSFWDDFYIKA